VQTAEFNHNDFSNTNEADKALLVKFFHKNVQNKLESQKQGRPIFTEKIYIEIRIAGQRDAQACRPVTHADKQRFPAHFKAFEDRVEPPTEGMPLAEWPQITRTQADELAFLHVKTVEQLASVKDSNISNYMGGYTLRDKAKKWLELNDANTVDHEKEEMRSEIAELKAAIKKLVDATEPAPINAQVVNEPDALSEGGPEAPSADAPKTRPRAKRNK
tara:strand:+ start:22992 stop:23642 length:651 start_codon:yes stop_codon:yes gene_type:complete